jgi:hypothetical protein
MIGWGDPEVSQVAHTSDLHTRALSQRYTQWRAHIQPQDKTHTQKNSDRWRHRHKPVLTSLENNNHMIGSEQYKWPRPIETHARPDSEYSIYMWAYARACRNVTAFHDNNNSLLTSAYEHNNSCTLVTAQKDNNNNWTTSILTIYIYIYIYIYICTNIHTHIRI